MIKLKTVIYRGGIAAFQIPDHWTEEYKPEGGGTFYDDSPDSGTLRLNILGFESKDTPASQMAETVFRNGAVSRTKCGLPLRSSERTVDENGEHLLTIKWEIAVPVSPRSLRLAVFSYTILESQRTDPRFTSEIALLENSIREGRYSREAGQTGNWGIPKQPPTGAT